RARILALLEQRHALTDAALDHALLDNDDALRLAAIDVLGARSDARSEQILIDRLILGGSGSRPLREAALAALARRAFADPTTRAAEIVLSSTTVSDTRAEALRALASRAKPEH